MATGLWLLLLGLAAAGSAPAPQAPDESIEVKVRGTLRAGVAAIGAETTGYTIKAEGITWELDLGNDEARRTLADSLDGKPAVVTGTLAARPGVEIRMRMIVTVTSLAPGQDKAKAEGKS